MIIILFILLLPITLLVLVELSSKGECYYCGKRFGKHESLMYRNSKKWCGCKIDHNLEGK